MLLPWVGTLLVVLVAAIGCDPRRDGGGTLARVRGGTLRVGVVEHRPWTTIAPGGGVAGIEGALVAELARELGARVTWVPAGESQLLEALRMGELDLVIGGLTSRSPWRRRVAFTRPFYTDTIVVGAPPGMQPPASLAGRTVAVHVRDPVSAAHVRRKGGVPQPIPDLGHALGLVAAPTWQLSRLGFLPTPLTLREAHHVIAVARRERDWLRHIERSVAVRSGAIPMILRTSSW